jgi:hypothetical protein
VIKQTREDYNAAYDIALDAVARLDISKIDPDTGLAAMLIVIMGAVHAMAPDTNQANRLIAFSQRLAEEIK